MGWGAAGSQTRTTLAAVVPPRLCSLLPALPACPAAPLPSPPRPHPLRAPCQLAPPGSERIARSEVAGQQLKEAQAINKSLRWVCCDEWWGLAAVLMA